MASAWIKVRTTPNGLRRYEVRYRLGGREAPDIYAGRFATRRDAEQRQRYVAGELAARRVPDLASLAPAPTRPTVATVAQSWQDSRIDVAETTKAVHRKAVAHVVAAFGNRDPASLSSAEIGAWVGDLAGRYTRGTVQKILGALAMVLDYADVTPNPARDRAKVRLPRDRRVEVVPPTARETEILVRGAAPRYRLPLIVLEATGMRVNELETLRWGDVDVAGGRRRVAREHGKAGRGRWVNVPPEVFAAADALVAREDRDLEARVFDGLTQARLRTDMARTCRAHGIPLHSPHDLRHRRISLWHYATVPWRQIGEWVGQADVATTANRYTHVVVDGEIDRDGLLSWSGEHPAGAVACGYRRGDPHRKRAGLQGPAIPTPLRENPAVTGSPCKSACSGGTGCREFCTDVGRCACPPIWAASRPPPGSTARRGRCPPEASGNGSRRARAGSPGRARPPGSTSTSRR